MKQPTQPDQSAFNLGLAFLDRAFKQDPTIGMNTSIELLMNEYDLNRAEAAGVYEAWRKMRFEAKP